tara:strand:- start:772 stop:2655 length:1884 start_codon:yes stop_codon:yes gene_type:complete
MTRTVPGSGASIFPVFNSIFGVREVYVTAGGSGYDPADPPRLRIENCGTPIRDAVLRPVIDGSLGEITAVEVLDPGEGYDPMRLEITDDGATVPAEGKIFLKQDGAIDFIQMTQFGDEYFAAAAEVKGGGGSGSELVPITGLVTGLAIEEFGRNYTEEDVNIIISGGGGQGATGVAGVNPFGKVTAITLTNPGEFFEDPPLIQIIGGGGSGASASAFIDLGSITSIDLLAGGDGYVNAPQVIFTRDTNLIKTARNRQSLNSVVYNLSGILTDVGTGDETIHVESTAPYPGSGKFLLGREVVRYTGKTDTSFIGCDRGTNFRFDQKVILDTLQNDPSTGDTLYDFQVTDKVRRVIESASNRVAIVYDWDETERALYLTFQVDELAFIDAGRSGEKSKIIAFFAGTSGSSGTGVAPHTLIEAEGSEIVAFTTPLSVIQNRRFEDDDEEFVDAEGVQQFGDGIPDILNVGTDYENQVNLDGGIASSKYGIEEELGGTNTTLFQIGDQIYDGSPNQLVATIQSAGALGDGDAHISTGIITIEYITSSLFFVPSAGGEEIVTGQTSGVAATTTNRRLGPKTGQFYLDVKSIQDNDPTYKFAVGETVQGNTSGAQARIIAVEYNNFLRNEGEY